MREFRVLGIDGDYHSSDEHPDRGYHRRHWLSLGRLQLSAEVKAPSSAIGASLTVEHPSEQRLAGHLGIGLGSVFLGVSHPRLQGFSEKVLAALPSDMRFDYGGRAFSVRFFDHAVWWQLGVDNMGWSNGRSKWRDGNWHPIGYSRRQTDPELIEEREVLVPMPERSYRATAKLTKAEWGFDRLPGFTYKTLYSVEIQMLPGEQIPFPGKGENSWDCEEDAAFGMSTPGRTIEDGIGALVASVLRDRTRRGGKSWVPKKSEKVSA